jgi:hypothetical protein
MTRCVFQRWGSTLTLARQRERESVCTGRKEHEETRREETRGDETRREECVWSGQGAWTGSACVGAWAEGGQRVGRGCREWITGGVGGGEGRVGASQSGHVGPWAGQAVCVCVCVQSLCVCVCVCVSVCAREQRGTETAFAPYAQVLLRSVRPHGGMRGPGFPEADNKRLI